MSSAMALKSRHLRIVIALLLLAGVIVLVQQQTDPQVNINVTELEANLRLDLIKQESPDVLEHLPAHFLEDYSSFCWYDTHPTQDTRFRCLPKVYLAGMPKCGSTDLYAKIVSHPDLYQPPTGKENHYWARARIGKPTNHLQEGETKKLPFENYLNQMGGEKLEGKRDKVLIDGTQSLAWDLLQWEARYPGRSKPPYNNAHLIHAVAPGSKIVMIVRDPVERLYSDYLYFNGAGYGLDEERTAQSFDAAVKKEMSVMSECLSRHDLQRCCYDSHNDPRMRLHLGVYICYVRDWHEAVGRDNVLVVSLEDYSKQPLPVLYRIFSFIRVRDPGQEVLEEYLARTRRKNTRSKSDTQQGAMLAPTRRLLQDFYWPYNVQLARFLNDTRFLYNSM